MTVAGFEIGSNLGVLGKGGGEGSLKLTLTALDFFRLLGEEWHDPPKTGEFELELLPPRTPLVWMWVTEP